MPDSSQLDTDLTDLIHRHSTGPGVGGGEPEPPMRDVEQAIEAKPEEAPTESGSPVAAPVPAPDSRFRACLCLRCNHSWKSALGRQPRNCPQCHSAYWETPPVRLQRSWLAGPRYSTKEQWHKRRTELRHRSSLRRQLLRVIEVHGEAKAFAMLDDVIPLALRRRLIDQWNLDDGLTAKDGPSVPPSALEAKPDLPPAPSPLPATAPAARSAYVIPPPPGMGDERR